MTPVEAAGVGAFLTLVVALIRRSLDMQNLKSVILHTLRTTALTFKIPGNLVTFLTSLDVGPSGILIVVLATYVILGTFLEGIAMLVLTLPVVFPVMLELGYSPIWFGVIVVIVLEMGLISPPVGVNVFVVKSVAPGVPLNTIFKGIWPFWLAMLVCLAILVAFPQIALFLPNTMFN